MYKIAPLFLLPLIITACAQLLPSLAPSVVIENAHSGGSAVAVAADSTVAASGGWNGWVRLWSLRNGEKLAEWRAHEAKVKGMFFLRGGARLLTAGYDGGMAEWSRQGDRLNFVPSPSPVKGLAVDEPAKRILTGHEDGVVRLWELSDFRLLAEYPLHKAAVKAVALHGESGRMASSDYAGRVWVWRDGAKPRRLKEPATDAQTLAFSPDGRYLYAGTWFDLYRWKLSDESMERLKTEHWGLISQIRFGPGGDYVATISRDTDSAVLFLDPDSGHTLKRLQSHDMCGAAVVVSSDGRYVVTTSDDASVRIWDLENPVRH